MTTEPSWRSWSSTRSTDRTVDSASKSPGAVVTKHDLDQGLEMAHIKIDGTADRLRAEWERTMRTQFLAMFSANTALVALAVAAIKLI